MRRSINKTKTSNDGWFWTNLRIYTPFRALAVGVAACTAIVACGQEASISRGLDGVNYGAAPNRSSAVAQNDRLSAAADDLERVLRTQSRGNLSTHQQRLLATSKHALDGQIDRIQAAFATDRAKLEELEAGSALRRLARIEQAVIRTDRALTTALSKVPTDGQRASEEATSAIRALRALAPERPQQPLSSDLGFQAAEQRGGPVSLSAGVAPAYNAPTANVPSSPLARVPSSADLEQTPETRLTPAITALATQLGNDPVRIYNYVRNEIEFAPYYGARKGADQTLAERSGSDSDQAALLIALLRSSGVHARFVHGVVDLPASQAASWLGVDLERGQRLGAVSDLLSSGGYPTSEVRANGEIKAFRIQRVWAEAAVAQDAYRGVDENTGGRRWVPLDPSMKQTTFHRPEVNVSATLAPVVQDAVDAFADAATGNMEEGIVMPNGLQSSAGVETLQDDVEDALRSQGVDDDTTVGELIGYREIRKHDPSYLPSTTPFRERAVLAEYRGLPDALNARVGFVVAGSDPYSMPASGDDSQDDTGFSYEARTTDLANKRITVSYAPATPADAEIIDAYHGLLNAPAYAAALVPVLRVDGQVVARGHRAVSTGYTQQFSITYRNPGQVADRIENPLYVGALSAIALDLGATSGAKVSERVNAYKAIAGTTTGANVLTDARAGAAMSAMGSLYFMRNNLTNAQLAETMGVRASRGLSGAIVATDVSPVYVASFPVSVRLAGINMDVDQDVQTVVATGSDTESEARYLTASGLHASGTEGAVFSDLMGGDAASTTKVLEVAVSSGVPILNLTSENKELTLPRLNVSQAVRTEISSALVDSQTTVTIPRDPVTVGGWRGTGYIIARDGAAAYRISGGLNGGFFSNIKYLDPVWWAAQLGAEGDLLRGIACASGAEAYVGILRQKALLRLAAKVLLTAAATFVITGPLAGVFGLIFLLVQLALILWTLHLAYGFVKNGIYRCLAGDDLPEDESP